MWLGQFVGLQKSKWLPGSRVRGREGGSERRMRVPECEPFFGGMGKRNSSAISIFLFHMTLKHRFEFCFLFFVFAQLWKTVLNFVFRFSLLHHFEKRISISVFVFCFHITLKTDMNFVFALLWKTDSNFVSRFLVTLKNRSEFRLSFLDDSKNGSLYQSSHLKPQPPPWGWPGHSLFM